MSRAPLPPRRGERPHTTPSNPHTQLDQQPVDATIRATLARRVFAWPDVEERPTRISVPGARALWLRDDVRPGPTEAFMMEHEFAHLHPGPDQSLHACLPLDLAQDAIAAGWAELHPVAVRGLIPRTAVLLYAPRDLEELEIVYELLRASYHFAGGRSDRSG